MKGEIQMDQENKNLINEIYSDYDDVNDSQTILLPSPSDDSQLTRTIQAQEIQPQESLSLQDKEIEMIKNALEKHKGKRKGAATELGISERTLYRKIKQYDL